MTLGCALALATGCNGDDVVSSAGNSESNSGTTQDTESTSPSGSITDSEGTTDPSGSISASATTGTASATDTDVTASATDPTATDPTVGPTTGETDATTDNPTTGATDSTSDSDSGSDSDSDSDTDSSGSSTGNVDEYCQDGGFWTLDADFDQGALNNVNHDKPNSDQLQITPNGVSLPKPYMFIGQTSEGVALKVDTETGKQLGRYITTRLDDCPGCAVGANKAYPSRVIVDFEGDVLIANRAFSGQGSLTKIGGSFSQCSDRNNNGKIDSSVDANDDGLIDINDPLEYFGQADECLLWTIPVGGVNQLPRALTIDGKGTAWVGTYSDSKAYEIDLTTDPPEVVKTINWPSTPYGFVWKNDYLFSSALGAPVVRYDLLNDEYVTMTASGNYGIAVDQDGIGYYGGQGLLRCDFDIGGVCEQFNVGSMNGVAVDQFGQVWGSRSGTVYKFANDGTVLGTVSAPSSYGIAIGHDNDPRVISNYGAYRIDAGAEGAPPGAATLYNTNHKSGATAYNYTYSDFTGFGAQNISITKGEWRVIHDSENNDSEWTSLVANSEPEGVIPKGSSISYQVRAANTLEELELEPWTQVENETIDNFVGGRYAEVLVRLLIDDDQIGESPVLSDLCLSKL